MARPLDLTWIDPDYLETRGRLALCRAPGSGGGALGADLDTIAAAGIRLVICLQEARELEMITPGDSPAARGRALAERGVRFLHSPIEDYTAPERGQLEQILAALFGALDAGEPALVHCWGGRGRAGTVAACAMVRRGMGAADAILLVRWIRDGAIEAAEQEALIAAIEGTGGPPDVP